jgi:hypothetical protein
MGTMKTFGFAVLEAVQIQPGSTRMEIFKNCEDVFSSEPIGWSTFKRMFSLLIHDGMIKSTPGLTESTFALSAEGISVLVPMEE